MERDFNDPRIKQLNDLYVLNRWKYLKLYKNDKTQEWEYKTETYYKTPYFNNNKTINKPLIDNDIAQHLKGKYTIGVFAGKVDGIISSKFMTFDIDVRDKIIAIWYVYKIGNSLIDHNINDFYISNSGNKGWHIDLFFDYPIPVSKLQRFHSYIVNDADCINDEFGKVEYWPTVNHGVKIPLGFNYRNKASPNYCYFADYEHQLRPIEDPNYIYNIKKIDNIHFQFLIDELTEDELEIKQIIEQQRSDYESIKQKHQLLPVYRQNIDEDITVEAMQKLEVEGLKHTGTRHNSLFDLCRYYKYCGMDQEDNQDMLLEWMRQQPENTYSTPWDKILKEIESIVKYIYENDCSITADAKDITVNYVEIKQVLKANSMSEKLLLFAMLIHSKRYATKNGVFYFPYSLIEKTTGLSDKTITKCLTSLSKPDQRFIEVIVRNEDKYVDGKWKGKKNNKYKILIIPLDDPDYCIQEINEPSNNVDFIFNTTNNENADYKIAFDNCIMNCLSKKEIRQYCTRRYYESLLRTGNSKPDI